MIAVRFETRTLCFVVAGALGGSVFTAVAFEIATGGFRPGTTDYRLTGTMHSNVLAVQAAVVAPIAYAFALRATAALSFGGPSFLQLLLWSI